MKIVWSILFVIASCGIVNTAFVAYSLMWVTNTTSFILIAFGLFSIWLEWLKFIVIKFDE